MKDLLLFYYPDRGGLPPTRMLTRQLNFLFIRYLFLKVISSYHAYSRYRKRIHMVSAYFIMSLLFYDSYGRCCATLLYIQAIEAIFKMTYVNFFSLLCAF
jgi:hypothetical protein